MSGNIEEKEVVELKSVTTRVPEHAAQTINDFNATGMPLGRLIHFGKPTLEFKCFTRSNTDGQDCKPAVSRKNPVHPVHPCESKICPCSTLNRFPAGRRRRLFQVSGTPALPGRSFEEETAVFRPLMRAWAVAGKIGPCAILLAPRGRVPGNRTLPDTRRRSKSRS